MTRRLLVLEVDEDKYDGLLDAMSKRNYVRVVDMSRDGRKQLSDCPACRRKLSREVSYTINENMVEALTRITQKMTVAKTVVITNKDQPADSIPIIERERAVEVDATTVFRAVELGLLRAFMDGSRSTHHITADGMGFLTGEKAASPCTIVTLDGEVVEKSGQILVQDIKFKDQARSTTVLTAASRSVGALPDAVVSFVVDGQMSLL